jgi:pre-rRNA-processing protein TSR4
VVTTLRRGPRLDPPQMPRGELVLQPPPEMEPSADKLRGLRITSLDDDEEDDEPELPHPLPAATVDYDDDDEEEEAEVMLGLLEEPKRPGLLLRHLFPSKAGGIPVRAIPHDC